MKCYGQIGIAIIAAGAAAAPAIAQVPAGKPFSMRGVELGITIDQFRVTPVPEVEGRTNLRALCQGEPNAHTSTFDGIDSADQADGIVSCQWFGRQDRFDSTLFVDLGAGKVLPVFDFLYSGGAMRLFRIRSFANSTYYPAVRDALTRGYGAPKSVTEPFQTVGGATFTQATSVWSNGLSDIVLTEPCRRLQRYCITYRHGALGKVYDAMVEKRAATAAGKL